MAKDVNNNAQSTTPGTMLTTDIDTTATRDHTTLFKQLNLTNPEKVQCQNNSQNQNRPKLLKITPPQQEATHQATPGIVNNQNTPNRVERKE